MVRTIRLSEYRMAKNIPWTIDEIERDWLSDEHVQLPPEDVVRAFSAAERSRGRD